MVDALGAVQPLAGMTQARQAERAAYKQAALKVTIDHTENSEDYSFPEQVLKFFREHGQSFPAWSAAARIIAFTSTSAASERVFSLMKYIFGNKQESSLMDYAQAACMLRYTSAK